MKKLFRPLAPASRARGAVTTVLMLSVGLCLHGGAAVADTTLASCSGTATVDTWVGTQGSYAGRCFSNFTVGAAVLVTVTPLPGADFSGSLQPCVQDFQSPAHGGCVNGPPIFENGTQVSGETSKTLCLDHSGWWNLSVKAGGRDPATGSFAAEVTAAAPSVPGAPQNLTAATRSPKGVALTWLAPPPAECSSPVTGYRILRGTSSGGEALLSSVGNVTQYADTATKKGVTYYYRVTAVNAAGEGPASNEASAPAR